MKHLYILKSDREGLGIALMVPVKKNGAPNKEGKALLDKIACGASYRTVNVTNSLLIHGGLVDRATLVAIANSLHL